MPNALLLLLLLFQNAIHNTVTKLPDETPADPRASKEARAVLTYLKSQQGKALVSGQTDYADVKWIQQNTGKTPVILGLDFMHYPTRMGHQTGDTATAIDWFKNQHGIITYQWHWSSPSGAKDASRGFYAQNNSFDLAEVLKDSKSPDYQALLTDIDDVAAEMQKLSDAHVPVIFRALHEAQGGWFWWGSKGAASCKTLYNLIFNRLTQTHHLHNILWAWTAYPLSQKKGDPQDWYPGDDKVDFVVSDYCESKADYDDLVNLTHGHKLVALAETMNAPDPDKVLSLTPWAYWVTWARRDWNQRSNDDIKRAMANPRTITLAHLDQTR